MRLYKYKAKTHGSTKVAVGKIEFDSRKIEKNDVL
jgi:ribosomal protein L1